MKMFLAILICKLGHALGGLLGGRGSSLPGKYALRLCPDILRRVTLPPQIVAVTGSNGKTSTVEMIAAVFRAAGKTVVYNREGSNQIEGVATTILSHVSFGGHLDADVLLLESDERYAAQTFRFFHPTKFLVTNLYRDQLTRNGHPEWVYDALKPAMTPDVTLILNADDPTSARFGVDHPQVRWYGVNRCDGLDAAEPTGVYDDGAYCPVCKSPMRYNYRHFNHIGSYFCPECNYAKPSTHYSATSLDLESGVVTLNDTLTIHLDFPSVYNVYNILAAYAVCRECGVGPEVIGKTLNNYVLKNGRQVRFHLGGHRGTLLISKHENSIAYDTNLRFIAARTGAPCVVMVLVDAVSRKYFTSETSWLWDIDFDQLNQEHVEKILLCGQYAGDLAVRLSFTALPPARLELHPDVAEACSGLKLAGDEDLYVVTCFSDQDKLLSQVEVEKEAQ